jgi:hypothetical protein
MKWEELIAEARAGGYLKFCANGIAVLQQLPGPGVLAPLRIADPESSPGGDRQSESAQQDPAL